MKTMAQVLKRQGALVRKIAAGAATDDERAEALKLQEALDAAAAAATPAPTATMTLAEFQKLAESELAELEKAPDDERLSRLQRNLKSIREQGKSAPDDVVTVEVAPPPEILDDLEAKTAAFDQRTRTGVRDAAPAAPAAPVAPVEPVEPAQEAKFDKGAISQQLAVEALEALISKLAALRVLLTAGTADSKAFESAFDGWWTLQDAVRTFSAIGAGGAPAPAAEPAAPAEMSAEAPAPEAPAPEAPAEEVKAASWDGLSPRKDVGSLYRELRRGSSRVREHSRTTQ